MLKVVKIKILIGDWFMEEEGDEPLESVIAQLLTKKG